MSSAQFLQRIAGWQSRIETALDASLQTADPPTQRLNAAMRYSVLGGGKRLRPLLVYATGDALGTDPARLDAAAIAVELIHAYSLIHDDLPAMDNDDLRRGRPTCHRAFDEGTAILAGDALQALAFSILVEGSPQLPDRARVQLIATLAKGIGTWGMAGGQAIDLNAVGRSIDLRGLQLMHQRKTGALIESCVLMGAIAAGCSEGDRYLNLQNYGAEIGVAFQIQDDILDVTGDTAIMGKQSGADAALGKPNYVSVLGLEPARQAAVVHRDAALRALSNAGLDATPLREMAYFVVDRAH